jgi:hypothetical protein
MLSNVIKAKMKTIHELKGAKFGSPEWKELEAVLKIKRKSCEIYGIGQDIDTPDGKGRILTIHGRGVEVSLSRISVNQELHGFDKGNGGLHRTYLFKDFDCPLLLRSVKQLLPEHAEIIAKRMQIYPEDVLDWLEGNCGHDDFENLATWLPCYDLLRGFGYALDYTLLVDGAVRTVSVEEQIESGIIVLKKD